MSSGEVPSVVFEDDTWRTIMMRRADPAPNREMFLEDLDLGGQQWAIDALKEINKDQEPGDVLERANLKRKITAHGKKENNLRSAGKIEQADKQAEHIQKLKDKLKNMETGSHTTGGGRRKKKKSKRKKHSKKKKHSKRRKSSKRKSKRRKSKERSKRR